MSIRHIHFLSEAEIDLDNGRRFYEGQEHGVGEYFWDSILSDIESLFLYAGIHAKEYGYYRMPAKRFPYSIYYDVNSDTVFVIAVLPMRRNPQWLSGRLNKNS